jgi:TolB-like protein
MTRTLLKVAVSLSLLLAAPAARAEDVPAAALRVATALADQLPRKLAHTPVVLALSPVKETITAQQSGVGRAFGERLAGLMAASKGLKVLDWQAVDKASREKLLGAVNSGALALPAVPELDALVVVEASGGGDGVVKVQLRVVALPAGNVLASEAAKLDASAKIGSQGRSEAVDVAIRRVSDMLASGLARLPGSGRYQRLAVLPLQEIGPESKKRELGAVVTAEIATDLRQYHGLLLVERARLGAVLAEVKLGEMGVIDPKNAPRLGKLADAQALVMGTVADAGDRFLVDVRIVSTETAETLATGSEAIASASLIALSADAVVLRSRGDAVFRSALVPGWGQLYNRQPIKAAVIGAAAVGTVGAALYFHLKAQKAEQDYQARTTAGALGGDPSAAAAALRQDANTAYQRRNGFLWAAAGVWAVGTVDAYLFGVDGARAADGLTLGPSSEGLGVALAGKF